MDNKRIALLYLDAALYRASVEKYCKAGDEWLPDTLTVVLDMLAKDRSRVVVLEIPAVLRYQQLIEVACEYLRAHFDPDGRAEIERIVWAIGKEARSFRRLRGRDPDAEKIITVAAKRIVADLQKLLNPGA